MHNEINKAIMAGLKMITLKAAGSEPVIPDFSPDHDPDWRSQKTARKRKRYLSNAPKAIKRRLGFKERRG